MRMISQDAAAALKNCRNFKRSNTEVCIGENKRFSMFLHGNKIASYDWKELRISNAGWSTKTTKDRINAILRTFNLGSIIQKNWIRYYSENWKIEEFNYWKLFSL